MSDRARVAAHRRGRVSETLAALLLRLKGYKIIARRYRTPVGEIDIVAKRGKRVVFVEVKRRASHAETIEAIPARQRRRIVRGAQYWLAGHPAFNGYELSFDVILIARRAWPRHIRDAFSV